MALDRTNLVSFGFGAGENKIWHYTTVDTQATAAGSGYFNNATNDLKQFDLIFGSFDTDGTPVPGMLIVTSASGAATVTTTAMPIA